MTATFVKGCSDKRYHTKVLGSGPGYTGEKSGSETQTRNQSRCRDKGMASFESSSVKSATDEIIIDGRDYEVDEPITVASNNTTGIQDEDTGSILKKASNVLAGSHTVSEKDFLDSR